jgi:predicted component of type VI protein secretion system
MIQFQVLSGKMAGSKQVARLFPFRIGRSPEAHLRLEDPGVWDAHAEINFHRGDGYHLAANPDSLVLVNGERFAAARLRNGDVIELGGARLRFWLADAEQKKLVFREWSTWLLIAAVAFGEIALIYLLLVI